MPKRSNEFQKLVFLTKKHAATGARVTESKLLRDHITGAEREVDVCVESTIAGHPVIISIECRDRIRGADVRWVEEMKCKHERLSTNALVLVSRSGFSKEALRVSKIYGIETTSMEELDENSAKRLFGDTSSLWSKTLSLTPNKVVIRVAPVGDLASESVAAFPDNLIYNHKGETIGTVKGLVEILLHAEHIGSEFLSMGDETHKGFEVRWQPARDSDGNPLCLKKLEPTVLRLIEFVKITGTCNFDISEFPLQRGNIGNVKVAWGSGSLMGKNAVLAASHDPSGEKKMSISTTNVSVKGTTKE